MAQHDFDIANQSAPNFRADLNNALEALATLSSGSSAPSSTYANMLWYDTANNILKMRNEADDAWINICYLDQSADAFRVLDNTQVVNTSGTQTGLLGDQATATWEAGTGTTESLVSPAKVKAAIEALAPAPTVDTSSVLSATAGATLGAVGTYAILGSTSSSNITAGSTYAGSGLRYAGYIKYNVSWSLSTQAGVAIRGHELVTPSGTWRAMGSSYGGSVSPEGELGYPTTIFLRIS